ncbi:MAG: hypothetical protein ABSF72_12135 [Candidatus Sulfotelmatobacter sp.]|jgi:hypothetical protein
MKIAQTVFLAGLLAPSLACGGYSKPATTPPAAGTMPTITELAPANVTHGSQAFVLTVNGTDFSGAATIYWNGAAETTTSVSPGTQLTTTIPATDVATPGTATVTVTNPGTPGGVYGGGTSAETSAPMTFTIN